MDRNATQELINNRYTDEQIAIMQAFVDGAEIEVDQGRRGEWNYANNPGWYFNLNDYRVKAKSLDIPWQLFKPKWKWAAMDENDSVYVFDKKPEKQSSFWTVSGQYCRVNDNLFDIDSEGVNWETSLVKRPE